MTSVVHIDNRAVPVWPDGQSFETLGGVLHSTRFTDTDLYHPGLKRVILEKVRQASDTKRHGRSSGGTKVHYPDRWGCAEATLLHERVLEFFQRALKYSTAVADHGWANVYRDGDYCLPHSHNRATASLVYFLDPGDADPEDPEAGRFSIRDPRFPLCCPLEEGCVTNPIYCDMTPGSLVMFPGLTLHQVSPYHGQRPRITLSWNVNEHAIPGSPFPPGIEVIAD
jgi:Putative 2OG-Fe(II) oxygenase